MATPNDLGYSLLPPDPGLINPDLALDAALAPVVTYGPSPPQPFGKGWAFDFLAGQFFRHGSSPAEAYGLDNLRVWIEKTLRTARLAHPVYCADETTEVLSKRGWLRHLELEPGMQILTLNHVTGLAEWAPAEAVHRYAVRDEPLVAISGRGHSSLTTSDHRWPVLQRCGQARLVERRWRTSGELTTEDRLIVAAPCRDVPAVKIVPDSLVEAVAWFWTEGSVQRRYRSAQVVITQSAKANPHEVRSIRRALTECYGPPATARMSTGTGTLAAPRWREWPTRSRSGCVQFSLNTAASAELLEIAPDKIVSAEFILALTRPQLELFVDVSFRADGTRTRHGTLVIAQKDPRRLAALELALILLGRAPHTYPNSFQTKARAGGYFMTCLAVSSKSTWGLLNAKRMDHVCQQNYSGTVWCPTTRNGTWLARRDGCVYYTGNSDSYGMEDPFFAISELDSAELEDEYEERVTTALLVHDRIVSVDDFQFTYTPGDDALYAAFAVSTNDTPSQSFPVSTILLGGAS